MWGQPLSAVHRAKLEVSSALAAKLIHSALTPQIRVRNRLLRSLHVGNFPVQESHLQILVHIKFLRTEVDDLLRFPHRFFDLFRSHSFLDALGLGLLLLLLLAPLLALSALLALVSLLAALLPTLVPTLLRVVTDRKHLPDNIFHLSRTCFHQRPAGKLEDHQRLVMVGGSVLLQVSQATTLKLTVSLATLTSILLGYTLSPT